MPWIKIFISHSTRTEEAKGFLDAVTEALKTDFDVRLDRTRLEPGDDWRAKLYQWMDEVHGAVLLLTAEALTSKFVQLEASVLSWRRFRQPKFVLLPVLVGVSVGDLSEGLFGEMELSRIQALNLDDPTALAQEVARLLGVLKERDTPRTAKEVLEDRVAKLLRKENTEEDLRDAGHQHLGWLSRDFVAGTDYYEKFALDLLKADIGTACAAIKLLADQGMHDAMELLRLVVPAWVAEAEAKPIAQIALSEPVRRAVSLNAADRWSLHTYISRSCYKSLDHKLKVCELVKPGYQDSLLHFKQQILDSFKPSEYASGVKPEDVKRRIVKRNLAEPVFVVFPPGFIPDTKILDSLRDEFSTVTFFVLAGDAPPEQLNPILDRVSVLKPLDPNLRQNAEDEYEIAQDYLQEK
jgi:hypothetical protein